MHRDDAMWVHGYDILLLGSAGLGRLDEGRQTRGIKVAGEVKDFIPKLGELPVYWPFLPREEHGYHDGYVE